MSLPVILVSAPSNSLASKIISEIIDNEIVDNKYSEAGWRVWQLVNKYYTASVRLQPLIDGEVPGEKDAEAHVIFLAENEGSDIAEKRRACASNSLRHGGVHLALLDSAEVPDSLLSWGLRTRYEVVALRAEGEDGEEAEEGGVARAREALHAHVWPQLRGGREPEEGASSSEGEEGEEGEGEGEAEEEEERAVERAEAFAEALGALASLASQPREEHDGLRRERAEQLVAAFCRALGHDLDACSLTQ